jgi:Carboxypeptidase regulatory-like domain
MASRLAAVAAVSRRLAVRAVLVRTATYRHRMPAAAFAAVVGLGIVSVPAAAATSSTTASSITTSTAGTSTAVTTTAVTTTAVTTTAVTSTGHPESSRAALAALEQRARLAAYAKSIARAKPGQAPAARLSGSITGVVVGIDGQPVAGACVTAIGASASVTALAAPRGSFVLGGLAAGSYVLEYRDCAAAGQYLTGWSGGVAWRSAAAHIQVAAGQAKHVPLLILKAFPAAALNSGPATFRRMLAAAAGRGLSATAAAKTGRITGLVTANGKPLRGVCVEVSPTQSGEGYGATTNRNGTYTVRHVTAGQYYVVFALSFCSSSANWLQQAYRDDNNPFAGFGQGATAVKVTSGHATRGINGTLRRGGEITGTVTSKSGRRLSGICVNANGVVPHGEIEYAVRTSATGAYHLHALFPGKYYLSFATGCGSRGNYAPASHKPVKIKYGKHSTISEVLAPGASITGKVTLGTSAGKPLSGMCVYATSRDGSVFSQTSTGRNGAYRVTSLGTGKYQLQIGPGCNNDANYTSTVVSARTTAGKVTRGRNAVLQPGAVISGTVTDVHGNPVAGMCVELAGSGAAFAAFIMNASPDGYTTEDDGSYVIDDLPAGTYEVGFDSGCGNSGSYAPYWYDNQTDQNLATPIVLATGGTQTVNAQLQPGATISGKVTNASGRPLSGICVYVATEFQASLGPVFEADAQTFHGNYSIPDLAPGQYLVNFGCGLDPRYAQQWYDGAGSSSSARIISAVAGRTTGIDAVLRPAGSISGVVTGKAGKPLAGVCVSAVSSQDVASGLATYVIGGGFGLLATNSHGAYTIPGLAAGRYNVEFSPCNGALRYAEQWYRGRSSPSPGTAVKVAADKRTAGIDARLTVGGTISGRVVNASGHPLRNICVFGYDPAPGNGAVAVTGKAGRYTLAGLPSGSYAINFSPCDNRNLVSVDARAIVTAPLALTGVNAKLRPGGSIAGVVTAAGASVGDTCVEVASTDPNNLGGFGGTSSDGSYRATGLAAGTYQVYFDPQCIFGNTDLAGQWYDNQPTQATATPVTVVVGQTTPQINAALQPNGQITGTVSGPSATPLAGICVTAVPVSADLAGSPPVTAVSRSGGYTLTDLTPGAYKVRFSPGCGATGYARQWWQDASSAAAATAISVGAGQVVSDISATMKS